MAFAVFNDLTRSKETFVPLNPGEVRFYVCGPTVYDYFHIGNARPFIVFDVMRRYLEHQGYRVHYVQNFTDVDDKMIRRAEERGISVPELAERFIAAYFEDADALGIRRATVNPRATEEIPAILDLIRALMDRGHAYQAEGDVYFDVKSYPAYGKLSKQSLEELQSGARVEVDPRKRHPLDFALWKARKPGEPFWESPWGPGRPGWHIECSAMSRHHLGETLDFHGGGCDLVFPHHENEIAQSEGATGQPFVRYWVHNGYLMIDKEKMSKSRATSSPPGRPASDSPPWRSASSCSPPTTGPPSTSPRRDSSRRRRRRSDCGTAGRSWSSPWGTAAPPRNPTKPCGGP